MDEHDDRMDADDHDDEMDADEDEDHEEVELVGRLLIGDGETGMMSVIDLEHGDVEQNAFDMGSRAGRIYATGSGRFAIAVASDANAVHVFDGGVYLEEHGDHFDLVEVSTRRMGLDLSGDRPVHLYVGSEWASVFYDGSGEIAFLNEHELEEEGDEYVPPTLNTGAHHGAAVEMEGDLFAVTLQHPDYASSPADYRLPESVAVMNLDGQNLYQEDGCEGLHGGRGQRTHGGLRMHRRRAVRGGARRRIRRRLHRCALTERPKTSGLPPSGATLAWTTSSRWGRRSDLYVVEPEEGVAWSS